MGILSRSYNLTNTESNSYRREVAKRDEDEERERKEEGEEEEEGGKEVGSAIRRGGAVVFRGFPYFSLSSVCRRSITVLILILPKKMGGRTSETRAIRRSVANLALLVYVCESVPQPTLCGRLGWLISRLERTRRIGFGCWLLKLLRENPYRTGVSRRERCLSRRRGRS